MAGIMVLLSLALALFFSLYRPWPTVVVEVNPSQPPFTNWCPAVNILRATGLKDARSGIAK